MEHPKIQLRLLAPSKQEARHVVPPKPEPFSAETGRRLLALSIETMHVEPPSGKYLLGCLVAVGLILVFAAIL